MKLVHATLTWVREDRTRRGTYFVLALVAAVLIFFPRPYVARAKLLPQDSSSAGLGQVVSALGGQLQSFAALLGGGRSPNDLYLIIGRSDTVLDDVINNQKLVGAGRPYRSLSDAEIAVLKEVDVRLLIGGVLEVETRSDDPGRAKALTAAYVDAISKEISGLGRQTVQRKREIVESRLRKAAGEVSQAEVRLNAFRRQYRLASPEAQLGSEISLRASLQAQLQARLAELRMTEEVAGPENARLLELRTQIASLRDQIADTNEPTVGDAGPNVAGLSALNSRYADLFRDYRFAQALYEVYTRANEQVEVEALVAESASYIQIIEPANLDPDRKVNVWAVGLLGCVLLLAFVTEWYAPATGLVSRRTRVRTQQVEEGA